MVICPYTFTQLGLRHIVRRRSSASDSDARCPGRSILVLNVKPFIRKGTRRCESQSAALDATSSLVPDANQLIANSHPIVSKGSP